MRQEIDGPLSANSWSLFSVDRCSRIAGQLREEAGPCPDRVRDHIFLSLEVRRPLELYLCRKAPWRSKRGMMLEMLEMP